jgi:hypothetical protein
VIRRLLGRHAKLRFPRRLWRDMLVELGRRGGGARESGAFLLSPRASDGRTVTRVAYFDDLDPKCLTGGITLAGAAFPRLWDLCDEHRVRVAGDVHTHPGEWVGQSSIDQDNPMVARVGHLGLIVPGLAQRPVRAHQVGVHEYLGEDGWRAAHGRAGARLLYIGWWA